MASLMIFQPPLSFSLPFSLIDAPLRLFHAFRRLAATSFRAFISLPPCHASRIATIIFTPLPLIFRACRCRCALRSVFAAIFRFSLQRGKRVRA